MFSLLLCSRSPFDTYLEAKEALAQLVAEKQTAFQERMAGETTRAETKKRNHDAYMERRGTIDPTVPKRARRGRGMGPREKDPEELPAGASNNTAALTTWSVRASSMVMLG